MNFRVGKVLAQFVNERRGDETVANPRGRYDQNLHPSELLQSVASRPNPMQNHGRRNGREYAGAFTTKTA
jgi:hypothetical protein